MPKISISFCHFSSASVFGLFLSCFLFSSCPGFAPLLLPDHFLKSSARLLQPTQPGRVHTDQRCVDINACSLLQHAQTHIHSSPPRLCPSVPSRTLQSMDEVRDVAPVPLFSISRGFEAVGQVMEKLWAWTYLPVVDFPSSHHQDCRQSLISLQPPKERHSKGNRACLQAQYPNEQFWSFFKICFLLQRLRVLCCVLWWVCHPLIHIQTARSK